MMHHKSTQKNLHKILNKFILFRCEFASRNSNGCQTNQYFTAIEAIPAVPGAQLSTGKKNDLSE